MLRCLPFLFGSALTLLFCMGVAVIAGDPSGSGDNFVLLQNGRVLQGKVTTQKDRVLIAVDGNSNLTLDSKQVAFTGKTLESLYDYQKSSIRKWGTGEHWHLAQWCIQYGLLDQAIYHYEVLEVEAGNSPRFKQLEHLLRQALLNSARVKNALHPEDSTLESTSNSQHIDSSKVVQASATTPSPPGTLADREPTHDPWAKHEIPGYIRQTFHKSILPILVSRCGQSGCHGIMGKSEFHIYQPVGEQSSVVLAQDLDEVLRYINREQVQSSPLLAYATKPHGIQKNPSFNAVREDDRALIERISQWINSLALIQKVESNMPAQYPFNKAVYESTTNATGVTQAVATSPITDKGRSGRIKSAQETEVRDRRAKLSKPAKSAPPAVFLTGSELSDLESAIEQLEKKAGGGSGEASTKKDPFDPEVFNQKFRQP